MEEASAIRKKILEDEYSLLNPEQKKAVFATGSPLLILAGAGSGKTTVIINKISYLLKYGHAYELSEKNTELSQNDILFLKKCLENKELRTGEKYFSLMNSKPYRPENILAITFTNKAAEEMRERAERLSGISVSGLWALTFHSTCVRLLRSYINLLGKSNSFTIYDEQDSIRLLEKIIKDNGLSEKYAAKTVKKIISKAKTSYCPPDKFDDRFREPLMPKLSFIYEKYQQELDESDALDFDDLIFFTVKLLEDFNDVRERIHKRFRYVLVDEYQDTNPLQYRLISLLCHDGNICVVGDDDQSIYRFMGASIENILSFEHQFENAVIIRLEQNYRSTQTILDAANEVISHNTERKGKNLWTANGEGAKIKYYNLSSQYEEADCIAGQILKGISNRGLKYNDFCVLYRTHSQSNAIELALKGNGIPYRIFGGLAFLKRKEIQDVLAYMNVIRNPNDKTRLIRIINEPKRGIGEATLAKIDELASLNSMRFFDIIKKASEFPELQKVRDRLLRFARIIEDLRIKSEYMKVSELYEYMLEAVGYNHMLSEYDLRERTQRMENLGELMNTIVTFEKNSDEPTLQHYLEETALTSDIDNLDDNDDAVVLITMHCSKGLEYNTVFITGFEEGLFPAANSINEPHGIEEERRLCYVAITRAKNNLYILSAHSRMIYGTIRPSFPSRFLKEIPQDILEVIKKQPHGKPLPERPVSKKKHISVLSGAGPAAEKEEKEKVQYLSGMRVRHQVFGEGTVTSVTEMSSDTLLTVDFEKVGVKKLMANFAKMEII